MTAEPYVPASYPGRITLGIGGRRATLDRLVVERDGSPAATRRRILDRVPTRTRVRVRLLEAKLDRYRWVNAGLRERLAELEEYLDAVGRVTDATARTLGHAHPAVVSVRAILDEARP